MGYSTPRAARNDDHGDADSDVVRLNRLHPRSIVKANLRTLLVPRPSTAVIGGRPIRDEELLTWAREVIDSVIDRTPVVAGG